MKIYPELLFKIQNPEHVDSPAKAGQVIQPLKTNIKIMKTLKILSLFFTSMVLISSCSMQNSEAEFEALFNGQDFTGWETYVGVPGNFCRCPGLGKRYGRKLP